MSHDPSEIILICWFAAQETPFSSVIYCALEKRIKKHLGHCPYTVLPVDPLPCSHLSAALWDASSVKHCGTPTNTPTRCCGCWCTKTSYVLSSQLKVQGFWLKEAGANRHCVPLRCTCISTLSSCTKKNKNSNSWWFEGWSTHVTVGLRLGSVAFHNVLKSVLFFCDLQKQQTSQKRRIGEKMIL